MLVFFSSRRRHTRFDCDWSSDVCSSDLTPSDARSLAAVVREAGAEYLDGAIFATPADVDAGRATILYSGNRAVFAALEQTIGALGQSTFVGEDIGAAVALEAAALSFYYGSVLAL